MSVKNPTPTYPPVGHCIYCKRGPQEGATLTDEHILALSFGGYPILRAASCTDCQELTKKFEGAVTGKMLLDARTHLKVRTRRPKKRPTELPTSAGPEPIIRHPFYLALQCFNPPEILGLPRAFPDPPFAKFRIHTAPETAKRHKSLGNNVGVPLKFNARTMQLTLAKTAHAFATAELGKDAFRPLLPDLIRGITANENWLVGSIPGANAEVAAGDEMPALYHLLELKRATSDLGELFLTCEITLFKPLGMPVYQVVVGPLTKAISSADPISSFTQHL